MDGAEGEFTFVSLAKCDPDDAKQQWRFPLSASEPYLASIDGKYCIQINGDRPWTGNRAVVWDCEAKSSDEIMQRLPGTRQGFQFLLDMTYDGGGKLCMSARNGRPAPTCSDFEKLRVSVASTAPGTSAELRAFALY